MKLMRHERYLIREAASATILVLLAFIALFGFFDLVNEIRSVGKGGYQLGHAVLFILLSLPGRVYELIPIAVLIGTLYALSTLARHSEIAVLRASGLSTRQMLFTLFKMAGGFALLSLLLGEGVMPFSERLAQEMRARAMNQVVAQQGFESGLWVKDGRSFINIRRVTPDARLEGIRIYQFDERNALMAVTDAREGIFTPPDHWRLSEVVSTILEEERARVEDAGQIVWRSAVTPDLLSVLMVSPERMSLPGLFSYTRHLADNAQKTDRYEIAIWKKLVYPLATLVMVALALPFGMSHNRVSGVSLKIFAGVMIGILFYMLNGLFSSLGVINAWPPVASAATPSLLFMLAAVGLLWWVERR